MTPMRSRKLICYQITVMVLYIINLVELKEQTNSWVNDLPTVIFFHGNSGNIGNRLAFMSSYVEMVNVNVLVGKIYFGVCW